MDNLLKMIIKEREAGVRNYANIIDNELILCGESKSFNLSTEREYDNTFAFYGILDEEDLDDLFRESGCKKEYLESNSVYFSSILELSNDEEKIYIPIVENYISDDISNQIVLFDLWNYDKEIIEEDRYWKETYCKLLCNQYFRWALFDDDFDSSETYILYEQTFGREFVAEKVEEKLEELDDIELELVFNKYLSNPIKYIYGKH